MVFTEEHWPIRLVNGSSSMEGRVEIQYNGTWGTICDDLWNLNAARVVCRMLGFTDASHAWNESHFGKGHGRIWLDEVFCTGNEGSIYECSHSGWSVHNCRHTEDVGVTCTNGEQVANDITMCWKYPTYTYSMLVEMYSKRMCHLWMCHNEL